MFQARGYRHSANGLKASIGPLQRVAAAIGFAIAITAGFAGFSVADTAPPDPIQEARALVDRATAILKDPKLTLTEERQQLRDLAAPYFDFEDMARSALGYHWRSLTPRQRSEYVELFTAFIEDAYLDKIQDYSGQTLEFLKKVPLEPGYVEVQSRVAQKGAPPISINFMLKQVGNDWKVYDVAVENISVTANYRNQFNRVITRQGFPDLMVKLKKKQTELASLLGKKS